MHKSGIPKRWICKGWVCIWQRSCSEDWKAPRTAKSGSGGAAPEWQGGARKAQPPPHPAPGLEIHAQGPEMLHLDTTNRTTDNDQNQMIKIGIPIIHSFSPLKVVTGSKPQHLATAGKLTHAKRGGKSRSQRPCVLITWS